MTAKSDVARTSEAVEVAADLALQFERWLENEYIFEPELAELSEELSLAVDEAAGLLDQHGSAFVGHGAEIGCSLGQVHGASYHECVFRLAAEISREARGRAWRPSQQGARIMSPDPPEAVVDQMKTTCRILRAEYLTSICDSTADEVFGKLRDERVRAERGLRDSRATDDDKGKRWTKAEAERYAPAAMLALQKRGVESPTQREILDWLREKFGSAPSVGTLQNSETWQRAGSRRQAGPKGAMRSTEIVSKLASRSEPDPGEYDAIPGE